MPNFLNRTLWTGDNLDIMRGMDSECVDLIYLDPPFNSKKNYAAPIGSDAAGAAFKDTWTLDDVDDAWLEEIKKKQRPLYDIIKAAGAANGKGMKAYLIMMGIRLLEMRRLLKPTGSIWLHCDPTSSHYLKLLMDCVLGHRNFQNEIIWGYGESARGAKAKARQFGRNNDILLYYCKDKAWAQHYPIIKDKKHPITELPSHIRCDRKGYFKTSPRGDYTDKSIESLRAQGRIYETRTGNIRIRYPLTRVGDFVLEPMPIGTVWTDIADMMHQKKKERLGYPTQKPLALLDRIIRASSKEGDMIFDPFCGCATALVSADRLNRNWIGVDLSPLAAKLVLKRIREDRGELFNDVIHRTDIPSRKDLSGLPNYKTHKNELHGRQDARCNGCREKFDKRHLEIDHIVPRSKGGQDNIENLQLLCASCNRKKGRGTHEALIAKLKKEGLRT